jgi:hypothetical protein
MAALHQAIKKEDSHGVNYHRGNKKHYTTEKAPSARHSAAVSFVYRPNLNYTVFTFSPPSSSPITTRSRSNRKDTKT